MKYMGGKARLAKELFKVMNFDDSKCYIEPFAGGMNMMQFSKASKRIANDIHPFLIPMWKSLICGWVPPNYSKAEYEKIRQHPESFPAHVVGWVGFNCSYSGKWFGGYAGNTKTKNNTVRDYQDEAFIC